MKEICFEAVKVILKSLFFAIIGTAALDFIERYRNRRR